MKVDKIGSFENKLNDSRLPEGMRTHPMREYVNSISKNCEGNRLRSIVLIHPLNVSVFLNIRDIF